MATATATKEKKTAKTNGAATKGKSAVVSVPAIDIKAVDLTLVGETPLIMHKWSEKAKSAIRDKQAQKAKPGREKRDPQAEFEDASYRLPSSNGKPGAYCFPAIGFKLAAVRAAKSVNMAMTDARAAFHVAGTDDDEFVTIESPQEPVMREDMVVVGNGAADLRYRPEFKDWTATIRVRYNARVISAEQVVNLFNIAGFGTGIGEWRPERDGVFGMYHVQQA